MRIGDWSSDVCSSDLDAEIHHLEQGGLGRLVGEAVQGAAGGGGMLQRPRHGVGKGIVALQALAGLPEIAAHGRASCGERGCPHVSISVSAVPSKNNTAKPSTHSSNTHYTYSRP